MTDIVRPPEKDVSLTAGESVYHREWNIPSNQTKAPSFTTPGTAPAQQGHSDQRLFPTTNKHEDDAKLLFGVVYSLRNLTRKLSTPYHTTPRCRDMQANPGAVWGRDDNFVSYRTSKYKLHYYETPTLLKFVLITDAKSENKRVVLHQIYVSLYVEFVVKNPLRELEGPVGVTTFALALDQFVRTLGDFN